MQVYGHPTAVPPFHRGVSPLNHYPRTDSHSAYRPTTSATRSRSASNTFDTSSRPPLREHYKSASLDPRAAERMRTGEQSQSAAKQHMHRPSYQTSGSYAYVGRDGRPVLVDGNGREPSRYTAPTSAGQRQTSSSAARSIYQSAPTSSRPSAVPTSYPRSASYPVIPDRSAHATTSRADRDKPVVPPYPYPSAPQAPAVDSYGRPHWNARDGVRREPDPHNSRPSHNSSTYFGNPSARPREAEEVVNAPLIHNALGWWPDQRAPLLDWDLSVRRSTPRYTKRAFDARELSSSPFTPPCLHMRLVLNTEYNWAFDIAARHGERYITLQGLLEAIAALMHTRRVPHAYWTRANPEKKEEILRAMLVRSGRRMPTVPPHRRPKARGQLMEEAVLEDAEQGYTNLLAVDLLCDRVMFHGMEFVKEPNEWLLKTTPRWR